MQSAKMNNSIDSIFTSGSDVSSFPPPFTTASEPLSHFQQLCYWSVYAFLLQEALYWIISAAFALTDSILESDSLMKAKLQSSRYHQIGIDWSRYRSAATTAALNHLCGSLPTMICFAELYIWRGCPLFDSPLPSLFDLFYQIAVILFIEELLFYYLHRFLHNRRVFSAIHSIHHSWSSPVAVAATDCHLLEHIFLNIFPALVGPLVAKAHYLVWFSWCCIAVVNTLFVHSGYKWSWLSAKNHDHHHQFLKCQYGVLGILDWLHSTRYEDLQQTANKQS